MTTDYEKLKEIFLSAYDTAPSEERSKFLDKACEGNPALRAKLAALFEVCQQPAGIVDLPPVAMEPTLIAGETIEKPGSMVGSYKLLQQIGEGGMGLVFMAEQQHPVKRKVALKVIKPGMDSRQVVARFEAERQALALMNHPNIAQVFDAGTTDSGRPYFIMELVKGVPITQYCDQNNLSPPDRLELFVTVCHAIQHAHQKGVIHRDVKPTNVLVTLHDGRPVPKVIDFGIAKAINQEMTERTLFTNFAQMIGTPLYMSPEQAEMSGLDIDTRSDVYSLGVLLYELLTGQTPFDKARLRGAAYDEICRILREEEPPRPSTRISTLGDQLTAVSSKRRTDPRRLSQLVRGDLDWIVMKALEKDRTRRYATASEFAADILRHLSHEPVLASPPGLGYRARKFLRKHRGPVVAAVTVLLALTGGLVTSLFLYARSERLRVAAERSESEANEARGQEQQRAAELEVALGKVTTERNEKEQALLQKETALARSDAQRLAALSSNVLPQDPGLALLLAAEAATRVPHLATVNNALLGALDECQEARTLLVRPPVSTIDVEPLAVRSVSYNGDGTRLLTVSWGKMLHRSQANTRTDLFGEFQGPETLMSVHHVYLSVAHVWESSTGKLLSTFRAPPNQVFDSVVLSPSGTVAAATFVNSPLVKYAGGKVHFYTNRVVRLYDARTGEETGVLKGHTDRVVGVAFSPDGGRLATTSWDNTARMWEVSSRAALDEPRIHSQGAIDDVQFSPDGRHLLTLCVGVARGSRYADDPKHSDWPGRETLMVDPPAGDANDLRDLRSGYLGGWSRGVALNEQIHPPDSRNAAPPGARLWHAQTGQPVPQPADKPRSEHADEVVAARFNHDGSRVATGSRRGAIRIWATGETAELVHVNPTGEASVESLDFSPDGTRILVVQIDGTLAVYDAASGQLRASTLLRQPAARQARFSRDGARVYTIRAAMDDVAGAPLSARRAVAGQEARWLWVLDSGNLAELPQFKGHADQVAAFLQSPDGNYLATASADGTARIWHARGAPQSGVLLGATGRPAPLVSSDGRLALAPTVDLHKAGQARGIARLYATADGALVSELVPVLAAASPFALEGMGELTIADFSPDGRRLLTVCHDRYVHILKPEPPGTSRLNAPVEEWPVQETLPYAPVRVWDTGTGRELFALAGLTRQVDAAIWSADGTRILTRSSLRRNYIYMESETRVAVSYGNHLQPEPDMALIHVWDASSGRLLYTATDELNPIVEWGGSIGWGPGNASVAASWVMGWLELETGRRVNIPNMFSSDILQFSPDGTMLLVRNRDAAQLLDATRLRPAGAGGMQFVITRYHADLTRTTSRELQQQFLVGSPIPLEGNAANLVVTRFSPDGRWLAGANAAHEMIVWEVATGRRTMAVQGHLQTIVDVRFSPDGRRLVTASEDRTARVWNAETGAELLTLEGHSEPLRAAVFSADGEYVVTTSADGTARTWPVDPLKIALGRRPRDLTPEERARFECPAPTPRESKVNR